MPHAYIDSNELYPYYELKAESSSNFDTVEVSEETLARWQRVMDEFAAVQMEMEAATVVETRKQFPDYFATRDKNIESKH